MNEVSRGDDVKHFRLILTEMQKALGSVVTSMQSTQDGIRAVATVLTEVCNAVNTNSGIDGQTSHAASTSATGIHYDEKVAIAVISILMNTTSVLWGNTGWFVVWGS